MIKSADTKKKKNSYEKQIILQSNYKFLKNKIKSIDTTYINKCSGIFYQLNFTFDSSVSNRAHRGSFNVRGEGLSERGNSVKAEMKK